MPSSGQLLLLMLAAAGIGQSQSWDYPDTNCADPECMVCHTDPAECTRCNVGYTQIGDPAACVPCAKNCRFCEKSGQGKCDRGRCDQGFVVDATSQMCLACQSRDDGCEDSCDVSGPGLCDPGQCSSGTLYDSTTKQCVACADGCHRCPSNGAGKCDPDRCERNYHYNSTTQTCYLEPNDSDMIMMH